VNSLVFRRRKTCGSLDRDFNICFTVCGKRKRRNMISWSSVFEKLSVVLEVKVRRRGQVIGLVCWGFKDAEHGAGVEDL
jgi:hypothetical protein